MDNKAYEQYQAQQPVVPRPERVAAEPWPELTTVEITVIIVCALAVIYAVYCIVRDHSKPPKQS
jgi:hypothetical protein